MTTLPPTELATLAGLAPDALAALEAVAAGLVQQVQEAGLGARPWPYRPLLLVQRTA